MLKDAIKLPEKGTYKGYLFEQWSDQFRQTRADYIAYIALHLAGALEPCRAKLQALVQRHRQQVANPAQQARHRRALQRLQNTMTGAALAYESGFHRA